MKAPCLYHHRVREGFFKLDRIPSELVANVFKYIPTLDMGRMMVVCKGFNQILSTNPSLWRFVDLDDETPNKSAFKIIRAFAAHSRNTLVAIKSPEWVGKDEHELLLPLLELNKGTLRRLDLDVHSSSFGNQENDDPIIRIFTSFPNIKRLNLTGRNLPEAEERIPGLLMMFATFDFFPWQLWSQEDLQKISSVRQLYLHEPDDFDGFPSLHRVLQACSSNLTHLSLGDQDQVEPLQFDLPVLSSLDIGSGAFEDMFVRPLPNLKRLEGPPEVLDRLNFKNLRCVVFLVESDDWRRQVDKRFSRLEVVTRMLIEMSSTLHMIMFKAGDESTYGIDPVLQTLKVDYLSPLCPLLSDLYVSKGQISNFNLLAEVMVSRNFAGKGWKFEGAVGDEDDEGERELERNCSKLVLHLDASHVKQFKSAEKEVLSRIPRWMSRRAGRTSVREWDGK